MGTVDRDRHRKNLLGLSNSGRVLPAVSVVPNDDRDVLGRTPELIRHPHH